jgi:transposase InsO family protein
VCVNGARLKGYIDFGSTCVTLRESAAHQLSLQPSEKSSLPIKGFGGKVVYTLGEVVIQLTVDNIVRDVTAHVVPDWSQDVDILIGHPFTESASVVVVKDNNSLRFFQRLCAMEVNPVKKVALHPVTDVWVPPNHAANILVRPGGAYSGEVMVDAGVRSKEGQEHLIPRTVIRVAHNQPCYLPVINLADRDLIISSKRVIARATPCFPDSENEAVGGLRVNRTKTVERQPLPEADIQIGVVNEDERRQLIKLLNEYRDCFAQDLTELGKAKSVELEINLSEEQPFTYRPYRLAEAEKKTVRKMINELLGSDVIEECQSPYASPILLVKKKDGQDRMCIDYRKLNSLTVKDRYPLPRIDDQLDRLSGYRFYTTLDLLSGYHQIPVAPESKKYTAFVTPDAQYCWNRMPFGVANGPSLFMRLMNKVLANHKHLAMVYLDDILIPSKTVQGGLKNLEEVLRLLRREGLTLNVRKCSFLATSVEYLGFEINAGTIKPGARKTKAVSEFARPQNVRQVRQFLGLTGYFRQFVKDYAFIAKPLTQLTKKDHPWTWDETTEVSFTALRDALVRRPVLVIYDPTRPTEVHTDASQDGIAGILLQKKDGKLHPVSYYSRQTTPTEKKWHSYELECRAVVESIAKFRVYLLGIEFTVVTDCNALKTAGTKRDLVPRIGRWWLQLQEYKFTVDYRPGNRMQHADALSRNPVDDEPPPTILHLDIDDWVLSSQLADQKLREIRDILKRPPSTAYEHDVYKNYALRNERVYRITVNGIQWVVPKGMRRQVIQQVHDEGGHFSTEKTLRKLNERFWFPGMWKYIEKYISTCIPCLYKKLASGRKEGFLHPIQKEPVPFHTIHVDHLGPFRKTKHGNCHLIVVVDGFTKFLLLKAVKSTKTRFVVKFLTEVISTYGSPFRIITDKGTAFTAKKFRQFCEAHQIHHVEVAVATPRANGQVERLNRSVLNALSTTSKSEDTWDAVVNKVQFAINNTINKTTNKTPSELLMGYKPNPSGLFKVISDLNDIGRDLEALREETQVRMAAEQKRQKRYFDERRKPPHRYQVNDQVLVATNPTADGSSRKLTDRFMGPLVVTGVLPNDRYRVEDLPGSM